MSTTCAQLILPALRKARISKLPGTGPSPEMYAELIPALNRMMNSWGLNGFLIYESTIDLYPWESGVESKTIGPTGDIVIPRAPLFIEEMNWLMAGSSPAIRIHMTPIREADEFAAISIPDLQITWPYWFYPNRAQPDTTIKVYPVPQQDSQIEVFARLALKQDFSTPTDTVDLSDGYWKAIVDNFAIEAAEMYPDRADLKDSVIRSAKISLDRIKRANVSSPALCSDADNINSVESDDLDRRIAFISGGQA